MQSTSCGSTADGFTAIQQLFTRDRSAAPGKFESSSRAANLGCSIGCVSAGPISAPPAAGAESSWFQFDRTLAVENVGTVGGENSQMNTPYAAYPMSRYLGVAGVGIPSHLIGGATVGESSTPQAGEAARQGPPFVLASEVRSPAMNFSTGMAAPVSKDASGSASGGGGGQAASGGVKTPVKKAGVAVGQKKPGRSRSAASQPANKKQKTKGPDAGQSIDALNDVTAVSGVNLREEKNKLLVGLEEESRTTEAMRKFVQKEDRLFLEKGPLRTKVQAIAAKCGLSVSDDMERCLSLACEERLRSMLYKLITSSKQRCDAEKDQHSTVVSFDPRRQLLLMKSRAKEAMETKQAAENEWLRKPNGAQQEEDDKMRAKAANVAARAAVGATDMLSKWQMMAAQGLAKRQDGDTGPGPGTGRGSTGRRIGARQGGRQPRSMTMKDVIALLEREPMLSKSTFLYRLYERPDRKNENSRRL